MYFNRLLKAFEPVLAEFNNSPPMQRLLSGQITLEHYQSLMTQISHHTRENPQLQALATIYFRGHQRKIIKKFYKHASSEIGHDQLALDDLEAMGVDTSRIPYENPLPATSALLGFCFYQIYNLNPVGYLGYLFFLEFMPTGSGAAYKEALDQIGVPGNAMSFLLDHTAIDVGHNKMMEDYVACLITNEEEFQSVVYCMRVTARLYRNMITEAFEQVDNPDDWGFSTEEFRPVGLTH